MESHLDSLAVEDSEADPAQPGGELDSGRPLDIRTGGMQAVVPAVSFNGMGSWHTTGDAIASVLGHGLNSRGRYTAEPPGSGLNSTVALRVRGA